MKVAIVEDNDSQRTLLNQFILKYSNTHNMNVQIDCYKNGLEIIEKTDELYDIIYFDVEMPMIDGMTAAKRIRKRDPEVLIVFVTNFVQYAIEGYSVNAIDFLLKPLTYFVFSEHFKKILPKIKTTDEKALVIKSTQGIRKINFSDIYYIESDAHYIDIYTKQEKITARESLKNMEQNLQEGNFNRCNNCYIINLAHVQEVNKNIVTVGDYQLHISRPRKKQFMEALTNYIGDVL